jgi:uncharacterized protein (TIGR02147 family)
MRWLLIFLQDFESLLFVNNGGSMQRPELSEFVDYRKYLLAFYEFKKHETKDRLRPYSFSDFSAAANIKSPNYLKLIIEGKRNLSKDMNLKFSKALEHNRLQSKEFDLLVCYCQEKDPMQRNQNLKELSEFRAKRSIENGSINQQTWEQVSNWLVWVLHAMVEQKNVEFTPEKLRTLLRGQVNEAQIQMALKKLVDSGDIIIDPITRIPRKTSKMMSGLDSIPPELVRKIQSELIYLGLESLHKYGPHEREVSGFTLAMTDKEYEWARFELRKLRKKIQQEILMNREETQGDRVYQVNIQLFPITDSVPEIKAPKMDL